MHGLVENCITLHQKQICIEGIGCKHVIFDENILPSLPSQKQLTEDVSRTLSYPSQSTEEETNSNYNTEDCLLSIDSTTLDNESEEISVDALEKQPKLIQVIGPRDPTLISSEINSNKILPFSRRKTKTNPTNLNLTPKRFNEAISSPNKEKWNLAIKKEIQNIEKLNMWTQN
ncbi:hypothetical protein O181_016415 [Austropuccinia psidii MF-1]|uniref:Uncharacterized protein n=1 Tax=Austropuccinia psidii MF-1 TaxID=1389203 RepID=A0A9Q3C5S6_9BASI|nr:hypothetical protein [Austropuccinia psidii MF-1]